MRGPTKLSLSITNTVRNTAPHRLHGASRDTPVPYLLQRHASLLTGMKHLFSHIDIEVNAYYNLLVIRKVNMEKIW